MHLNLGGCRPHAQSAPDHAGQVVPALGRKQRLDPLPGQARILAPPHQYRKGAIGLEHRARTIQRHHAARDGLHNRLQFSPPLFDRLVGRG